MRKQNCPITLFMTGADLTTFSHGLPSHKLFLKYINII